MMPGSFMIRHLVALLLGSPFWAAAAEPAALSLEATFDAYAQARFQDDTRAKELLRRSLQTASTPVPADIELKVEGRAFQNLAEVHGEAIADALQVRRKRIHCRATGSDVEEIGTLSVGTVTYRCVLPDMSGHFEAYRGSRERMKDGEGDPMDDASFRTAYATALRSAPDALHEGSMRFIRNGDGPWDSIEMLYFDADIRGLLMPMHAWDERIEGEGVPADLPPQAEYTLQARVLLQNDAEARQLLRALGENLDPGEAMDWRPIIEDVPAWLSRQDSAAPSPDVTAAFAEALALRLPRVNCAAREFVPLGSPEIGMYTLVCQHPDVEPLRQAYLAMRAAPEIERQARIDALFQRWATLLREAPAVPHCTPVVGGYQARHAFAHAERMQQLYQAILWRLLPFDVWLEEPVVPGPDELCDLT